MPRIKSFSTCIITILDGHHFCLWPCNPRNEIRILSKSTDLCCKKLGCCWFAQGYWLIMRKVHVILFTITCPLIWWGEKFFIKVLIIILIFIISKHDFKGFIVNRVQQFQCYYSTTMSRRFWRGGTSSTGNWLECECPCNMFS